jgi:hypothetical protein
MTQTVSQPDEMIMEFRQMLLIQSAAAQAIDRQESW